MFRLFHVQGNSSSRSVITLFDFLIMLLEFVTFFYFRSKYYFKSKMSIHIRTAGNLFTISSRQT